MSGLEHLIFPESISYIYAPWDEPEPGVPQGWYLSKVMSVIEEDTVEVIKRKGRATEIVKLAEIQRCPAQTSGFIQKLILLKTIRWDPEYQSHIRSKGLQTTSHHYFFI